MTREFEMNPEVFRDPAATISLIPAGKALAFIVARPTDGNCSAEAAYALIAKTLASNGLAVAHERLFGSLTDRQAILAARSRQLPASNDWPVTFIEGTSPSGSGLAGVQIQAVRPDAVEQVRTLNHQGQPCGRSWRREGRTYMILQSLDGVITGQDRSAQTRAMIERAESILRSNQASYRDVVRTWIYLDHILDWYRPFNLARSEVYTRLGLMEPPASGPTLLPASTGIEGRNPAGAAVTMDLLAVTEPQGRPSAIAQMTNLRQQDAFRYGSAFSRGAAIAESDSLWVQISGTAAIDGDGKSCFPGDTRRQIEMTLDCVDSLLSQQGLGLKDIASACLFLKHGSDLPCLQEILRRRGLQDIPGVCVVADVCREDLLFELDGIAARTR